MTTLPEPTRHVEFETCCNFRDLGGYPASDGRRTRWRTLFRADGLTQLTEDDHAVLHSLGVRSVLDLRTDLEVESRGRFPSDLPDVTYYHLPLTDTLPGAEDVPEWGDSIYVAERYASYLQGGASSLCAALEVLSEPGNLPAVFHCSVGKDRTGVLAAVVLGLLGVPDGVIIEDYVLSAMAMTRILDRLRREFPHAGDQVARFAPVILSVEPTSMAGFLQVLRERYGSFEGLAEALDRGSTVERLRRSLLEPA